VPKLALRTHELIERAARLGGGTGLDYLGGVRWSSDAISAGVGRFPRRAISARSVRCTLAARSRTDSGRRDRV
jgi:hypothetical protein